MITVHNHSALAFRLRLTERSEVYVIPARGKAVIPAEFWRKWCAENERDNHALATGQLVAA